MAPASQMWKLRLAQPSGHGSAWEPLSPGHAAPHADARSGRARCSLASAPSMALCVARPPFWGHTGLFTFADRPALLSSKGEIRRCECFLCKQVGELVPLPERKPNPQRDSGPCSVIMSVCVGARHAETPGHTESSVKPEASGRGPGSPGGLHGAPRVPARDNTALWTAPPCAGRGRGQRPQLQEQTERFVLTSRAPVPAARQAISKHLSASGSSPRKWG